MLLDFAGPSDVFSNADNYLLASGFTEGYEALIAAPTTDRTVSSSTGVEIRCPYHVMEIALPIDTLIIAGNDFRESSIAALTDFYGWLAGISACSRLYGGPKPAGRSAYRDCISMMARFVRSKTQTYAQGL